VALTPYCCLYIRRDRILYWGGGSRLLFFRCSVAVAGLSEDVKRHITAGLGSSDVWYY